MCTEAMSVCTSTVMAAPRKVERPSSSASTIEPSVSISGAAVLGRIADAEEAEFAHPAQHLARHVALLLPLQAMRLDLVLDEAADLRAQQLVLFAEVGRGEGDGFGTVHGRGHSRATRSAALPSP